MFLLLVPFPSNSFSLPIPSRTHTHIHKAFSRKQTRIGTNPLHPSGPDGERGTIGSKKSCLPFFRLFCACCPFLFTAPFFVLTVKDGRTDSLSSSSSAALLNSEKSIKSYLAEIQGCSERSWVVPYDTYHHRPGREGPGPPLTAVVDHISPSLHTYTHNLRKKEQLVSRFLRLASKGPS